MSPTQFFSRLFVTDKARVKKAANINRKYVRLEDLPDYLLDDIGLTRADLQSRKSGPWF